MRVLRTAFLIALIGTGLANAQIPTPRQDVLEAQVARPADPWPRGQGHVVLALPGSLEKLKAYHEPGGSFSPEFGSFGVSLWVTDQRGTILETSDSIPLAQIRQKLAWHEGAVVPAIQTETDEYMAEWSLGAKVGSFRLLLRQTLSSDQRAVLAVRSVGPAGAAIESLLWNGREILVNGRYSVRLESSPTSIYVGPEGPSGWTMAKSSSAIECHGKKGWCYARLELPPREDVIVQIVDNFPPRNPELTAHSTRSNLQIDLPDGRFADSLNAQVAHLMMGLVDNQTRPGDPNNYPLTWLRDGAYMVVALARAGELDTTRELARYFAERDFFGGFGAEGDNPGLALWVLQEVASRLRDPAFDEYLWPSVYRKAEFILGLQSTREPIERIFAQIIVPRHRARQDLYELAQPAKDGLIEGRMDNFHPEMYVTAVSYGGLMSAAQFADRVHRDEDARRWRAVAAQLQRAWVSAYKSMDPVKVYKSFDLSDPNAEVNPNIEYTFVGVWGPWIATDRLAYRQGLEAQWDVNWDSARSGFREVPLWTYFNFEKADQFVLLGDAKLTWKTLEWFWDHQPSPGLYSWWEGDGEENSFHSWDYVRGWVHPPHVTPHYQSAGACLLTQLDMLAYVDRSSSRPLIVIGAGMPASWNRRPMHVHGLTTEWGNLDWDWDGRAMVVKAQSQSVDFRLGSGFPAGAKVTVLLVQSGGTAN